jgi:hypothetical protein
MKPLKEASGDAPAKKGETATLAFAPRIRLVVRVPETVVFPAVKDPSVVAPVTFKVPESVVFPAVKDPSVVFPVAFKFPVKSPSVAVKVPKVKFPVDKVPPT